MIRLIDHVQEIEDVHIDSMAQSECAVARSVADRTENPSHRGAIRSVSGPLLHSVVELIENIDRCVGHEHIGRLVELIGCRPEGTHSDSSRG